MTPVYELSIANKLAGVWALVLRCENWAVADCMAEHFGKCHPGCWVKVEKILR